MPYFGNSIQYLSPSENTVSLTFTHMRIRNTEYKNEREREKRTYASSSGVSLLSEMALVTSTPGVHQEESLNLSSKKHISNEFTGEQFFFFFTIVRLELVVSLADPVAVYPVHWIDNQ
jgi:hypothetical protein